MPTQRSVRLGGKAFARLRTAWLFSNFADSCLVLVLALAVRDVTGSDASAALVFFAQAGTALFAPIAGTIVDRHSRMRILTTVHMVAAITVACLIFRSSVTSVWPIYTVAVIYGLLSRFIYASVSGLVKELLPEEMVAGGVGQLTAIDQGMMIFAPAAGVLVFKIAGIPTVAALTAVLLLVSAAILSSLPVSPRPAAATERASWLGDFISGFRELTTIKSLMLLTLVSALSLGSAGIANVATIQLVTTGLGREAYWIGLLTSVQGFGSVATGLLAGRIIGAMGPLGAVKWGLLTFGLALGALSVPLLPVVVTAELMSGVGVTMFMVGMTVYRQLSAGSDMQGRLSSVTGMVISLAVAIGTLLGASVINVVSFKVLFAVVAAVVLACFGLLSVVPKGTSTEK